MSEQRQSGTHPDADSLNAFIEGVLPEHARLECLAHLAECPSCRGLVFLAQPVDAAVTMHPADVRRRWFAPVPVLAAVAATCTAVVVVWLYLHHTPAAPARNIVARVNRPLAATEPTPKPNVTTASRRPKSAKVYVPRERAVVAPPILPDPPAIPAERGSALLSSLPLPPPIGLSAISGLITDASGAAVAGAAIKVRQLGGAVSGDRATDRTGHFSFAELPAGRYELQITAPGFSPASTEIDLQPRQVAEVVSALQVGAVSEAVEVTAANATLATTSEVSPLLSGKLPARVILTSRKTMLALDPDGAVFVSRNAGRSWKAVKPVWQGKASQLTLAEPFQVSAVFQLTTDSGAVWLSRDGSHWHSKK